MKPILSNATANVTTTPILVSQTRPGRITGLAGPYTTIMTRGEFGGATITLEIAPVAAGPFAAIEDGAFTAVANRTTPLSGRAYVRAVLSGATGTTDVSCWIG